MPIFIGIIKNAKTTFAIFTLSTVCLLAGIIGCGEFTDFRNRQKYRTVKTPDGKTWMVDNLNFATPSGSRCYDDDESNCEIYGRLYDWETAMTVCPRGWRLPSDDEWQALIYFAAGLEIEGSKLETDYFGMSNPPSDLRWGNQFGDVVIWGIWWTSTEDNPTTRARLRFIDKPVYSSVYSSWDEKNRHYSVRCVRGRDRYGITFEIIDD